MLLFCVCQSHADLSSCRITSVLVARLILNLKIAGAQDYIGDVPCRTYLEDQTTLEDFIIGIVTNRPEDLHISENSMLDEDSIIL